jgi:hypothetical protein
LGLAFAKAGTGVTDQFFITELESVYGVVRTGTLDKKGNVLSLAVPLQTRSGAEGSRKLRFPDFMTTAQDGGKVVSLTHRPPLFPGNTPDTHFC